ncbi:MAG TPA: beta-N-acetylglucosaminidase domain-containing protein [Acidimicrobiales bacterium]|nr:beta-N-acetylglucosaminidase domain-containing protein [Acidimicrobiales bacterium]
MRRFVVVAVLVAVVGVSCSSGSGSGGGSSAARSSTTSTTGPPRLATRGEALPGVTPVPRAMRWLGPDVGVPDVVRLRVGDGVDPGARGVVVDALRRGGAQRFVEGGGGGAGLTVDLVVGAGDQTARRAFGAVRLDVPASLPAEGYALAAFANRGGGGTVVVAGADPAGAFYGAQTLRQLIRDGKIAGVGVVDRPAMRHRGMIEGFYGAPWTTDERLAQMAFAGRYKLNTYVYAPKDDPYHRDRWRDPYPADRLADLGRLVDAARANHVRFTFAISPGVSICYSDPADRAALTAKLDSLYRLGVRAFSIALDDIDAGRWNCQADAARYGPPSMANAARAQVDLVNAVQHDVAARAGTEPLQMVPTDYRGTHDSDYRRALRAGLDPAVEVMWTGPSVVPAEITVADATAAAGTYGRPVYLWDNTPVNDYPPTEGRLILAPYARRQAGLSGQVTGIVLNPMNQAAASRVQLVGAADFAWNDAAYDAGRARRAAAADLAGGDADTTDALLAFFDLENLAPTSLRAGTTSQPQAPALAAALATFRTAWDKGDRPGALAGLRPLAERLAAAPDRIRAHVDPAFVADCAPWLDATALWGRALVATLDGLAAKAGAAGTDPTPRFAEAQQLAQQARAVRTVPGKTRPQGPVRVGDGVLDRFLQSARTLG